MERIPLNPNGEYLCGLPVPIIKPTTDSYLRKKRVIPAMTFRSPKKCRQEPGGRAKAEMGEGMLLIGLLFMV